MLLLFLSQANIIRVTCCLRSCQPTSSVPPLSGYSEAALSPLSSTPTTAPMPSYTEDPTPSPSKSGHRTRSSPSTAWRPAQTRMPCWQSMTHQQTARLWHGGRASRCPPKRPSCYQADLVFRPAGFSTFSSGAARWQSRNRFSPTLDRSPPQMRYPQCQRTPPTRLDLWPLLLQADVRALEGALWRCIFYRCCPPCTETPT